MGRITDIFCATLGLIAMSTTSNACAQMPASPSGDPLRWSISARAQVSDPTSIAIGGLYLNDLNTSVPFVLIDHQLNEHWGLHGGYLVALRDVDGGPDRTMQFIRLGVTYQQAHDRLLFDNRFAHEIVLDNSREDIGGRIRNRMRLTYALGVEAPRGARLFGYVEPVAEYGLDRASRIDFAVGAGTTLIRGIRVDTYALFQRYPERPSNSVDALMIEVQLQAMHD
nr:hypothetical protein [Nitrosomonas nitrosa]